MKAKTSCTVTVALLVMSVPHAYGESELLVLHVLESGMTKQYGHPDSIVLASGFWAKSGSDVTASIGSTPTTQLLQMTAAIEEIDDSRLPADEGMTGSPGNGSVHVGIGKNMSLPNPASYYAVNGIGIEEQRDNPCAITLSGAMVDPQFSTKGTRILAKFELEKCKPVTGSFLDYKHAGYKESTGKFVRAVRVCGGHSPKVLPPLPQDAYSSTSWEIKGLTVLPGRVSATSDDVTPLSDEDEFTRFRCIERETGVLGPGWTQWDSCPDNTLLTGVRVYHFDNKKFTGLRVICQYPRRSAAFYEPVKDALGY